MSFVTLFALGLNAVVRRFQWIGIVPEREKPPTVSASTSSLANKSPKAEYFLKVWQARSLQEPSMWEETTTDRSNTSHSRKICSISII